MLKIFDYVSLAASIGLYLLIAWAIAPPTPTRALDALLAIPWMCASLLVPYACLALSQYALLGVHVRLQTIPLWIDLFFDQPRIFRMATFALLIAPQMVQLAHYWRV